MITVSFELTNLQVVDALYFLTRHFQSTKEVPLDTLVELVNLKKMAEIARASTKETSALAQLGIQSWHPTQVQNKTNGEKWLK